SELELTAVLAYKHLARRTKETATHSRTAVARAFQQEALIILTDKEWPKPKRLKAEEAFWDIHAELKGSKAEKLALRTRYPDEDLEVLRFLFVDVVGILETMTREELEARLRVPLRPQDPHEPQTSWLEGLAIGDFEDTATIRRGPGVLGDTPAEGGDFFETIPSPVVGEGASEVGRNGLPSGAAEAARSVGSPRAGVPPDNAEAAEAESTDGATEMTEAADLLEGRGEPEDDRRDLHRRLESEAALTAEPAEPQNPNAQNALDSQLQGQPERDELEDDLSSASSEHVMDPYKVLEVERDCDDATIRRAYKRLALRYHPDKNVGIEDAARRFQEIAAAYDILRDPERRRAYDAGGLQGLESAGHVESARAFINLSADFANAMFRSFFGGETQVSSSSSWSPQPAAHPATEAGDPGYDGSVDATEPDSPQTGRGQDSDGRPRRSGSTSHQVSSDEYRRLMKRLQDAEENAKMWRGDVETAQNQLQTATATRDRYLHILRDCYERQRQN
ncbi:unnamed protein product, partial [Polarella glacialis]